MLNNTLIRDACPDAVTMPEFFKENGYWTASMERFFIQLVTNWVMLPGMNMFVLK